MKDKIKILFEFRIYFDVSSNYISYTLGNILAYF